mmetsp:Transcript_7884/g.15355  ORF Transcript_7884/g.15355 Transcript_7884/m.15355 type:complete len:267 (-) Transcript_7884:267-1067(-)
MDGFTSEEIKCIDQLKEKYQSKSHDSNSTVNFPESNLSVSLCQICQGVGYVKEIYDNRILEKFCSACNGEGTFTQGGDESVRITSQNRNRSSESLIDRLERALKQLDKCQKEREVANKILSSSVPAEQEFLAQTLVRRLEEHIERLEKYVAKVRMVFVKKAEEERLAKSKVEGEVLLEDMTAISNNSNARHDAKSHMMMISEVEESDSEEEIEEEVPIQFKKLEISEESGGNISHEHLEVVKEESDTVVITKENEKMALSLLNDLD